MQVKGMMARGLMGALLAVPLAIAAAAPALAQDLMVDVANDSEEGVLTELYMVPAGEEDWGEDLLSEDMEPGDVVEVSIEDGESVCDYDIYAVYDDGGDYTETVDICETGEIVISD